MTDVTFTPEQIREIRRRIEVAEHAARRPSVEAILAAFPLPKVTRYRTFVWSGTLRRIRDGAVEYEHNPGDWRPHVDATLDEFARCIASTRDWTTLAAFADVCARPTEEVDA